MFLFAKCISIIRFPMQLLAFLSITTVFSLTAADVVIVQQCAAGSLPTSVDVIGCPASPCELAKGQDGTVLVRFKADRELVALVPKLQISFPGVTKPYELPDDLRDACKFLVGTACPVSQDEDVTYELHLPVRTSYPSINVTVELQLIDQEDKPVTCFQLEAKVA